MTSDIPRRGSRPAPRLPRRREGDAPDLCRSQRRPPGDSGGMDRAAANLHGTRLRIVRDAPAQTARARTPRVTGSEGRCQPKRQRSVESQKGYRPGRRPYRGGFRNVISARRLRRPAWDHPAATGTTRTFNCKPQRRTPSRSPDEGNTGTRCCLYASMVKLGA